MHIDQGQFYTSVHVEPTNNISITTVATPYQPNTLSPAPLPLGGSTSAAIPLTSTQTPPTFPKPSPWVSSPSDPKTAIPSSHHPNSTPCSSVTPITFSLTTAYLGLHHLKWVLREGFYILYLDPLTLDLLTKPPSVTFCKSPNLCQLIVNISLCPIILPYPLALNPAIETPVQDLTHSPFHQLVY